MAVELAAVKPLGRGLLSHPDRHHVPFIRCLQRPIRSLGGL